MRLIDESKVINEIERFKGYLDDDMIMRIKIAINKLPTIDAEPIRHGHWIMLQKTQIFYKDEDYDWRCSECNHVDCHNINVEVPYCWHCGARMDGVEE